jgi:hypothetical protein
VTTIDDIHEGYEEKGWDCLTVELSEESGLAVALSMLPGAGKGSMIVIDVSGSPEGAIVSVRAFHESGQPAELGRIESGQLGQMLLHVLT